MTSNFDNFCNLIHEKYKRCKGPTLPELSDNPRYVFSRCAPNPYTSGYKRVYYLKKGVPLTLDKCKTNPTFGTAKYEECRLARLAYLRKLKNRRKAMTKKD